MELIRLDINNLHKINEDIVATVGQFDGLHLAHTELISKTVSIGKEKKLKSAIFTFDPHPDFILNKDVSNTYVTPLDEKVKLLEKLGLDYLVLIKFDLDLANMMPIDFVNKILVANHVKEVVVGFDFKFGRRGLGKALEIEELSYGKIKTYIIDEIKYHDQKMGTTLVKSLLKEGKPEEVKELLGRFYKIRGKVVFGNQVGRTIDFPTANFKINDDFAKILPGVYVVRVTFNDKLFLGIANLGYNPSFNKVDAMVFETHIFNFNEDIYNQYIDVELIAYIRGEIKFESKEAFLKQIKQDKAFAINVAKALSLETE